MAQAPKKKGKGKGKGKDHKKKQQYLGNFEKNHCRIGIVGLPNVGKSSFFNTLSNRQVAAENYPFCTIKPSQAVVGVPDKRFEHLCREYKPKSRVQATLEVWDIAGLVRGAHEGKGLGNEFLSNIQAVDAVFHVVRAFKAKHIEHVEGSVDPVRDLEIISSELRKKDVQNIKKKYDSVEKLAKRSNKRLDKIELELIKKVQKVVEEEDKDVSSVEWTGEDIELIRTYNLFTAKPIVFLVNVSLRDWEKGTNKYIVPIKEWVSEHYPYSPVIPFSAAFEEKIQDMSDEEVKEYCKNVKGKSMINKIISGGYKALQFIHFFTAGEDEVKCWTIRDGTKAPQAAGTIHSDMENGFICAETFTYKDFKKYGSEHAVKSEGKYHQNGKNYVVKDGDVLYFKFNKPQGKKKG